MPRRLSRLTAEAVEKLSKLPGRYSDGGCLYLQVAKHSGGASWIFRYSVNGKERSAGLGSLHTVSLSEARAAAAEWRKKIHVEDKDPLEEKRKQFQERQRALPVIWERVWYARRGRAQSSWVVEYWYNGRQQLRVFNSRLAAAAHNATLLLTNITLSSRPALLSRDQIYQLPVAERGICGIYFLLQNTTINYIGQSTDAGYRVGKHRLSPIPFNNAVVLECGAADLDLLEATYIREYAPPYNRGLQRGQRAPVRAKRNIPRKASIRRQSAEQWVLPL